MKQAKERERLQQEFLGDKDDDMPDDEVEEKVEVDARGNMIQKQKTIKQKDIPPEMLRRSHLYKKVFKMAANPVCHDHLFCERAQMDIKTSVEERNPQMYCSLGFYSKQLDENSLIRYSGYLNRNFYYRNIMEKKRQLKEKIIGEHQFTDDGVEEYGCTQQALERWEKHTKNLGDKIFADELEQANRERKLANQRRNNLLSNKNTSTMDQVALGMSMGATQGATALALAGQHSAIQGDASANVSQISPDAARSFKQVRMCEGIPKEGCCSSIYHLLTPKHQRKGKIHIPTKEETLDREKIEIDTKAKRLIDKGICDVMRSYYGPFNRNQSQKAPKQGLGSNLSALYRKDKDKQNKKDGSPSKSMMRSGAYEQPELTEEQFTHIQEAQLAMGSMSLSKRNSVLNRKMTDSDRAAANLSQKWRQQAEENVTEKKQDFGEFIEEMKYRNIETIKDHNQFSWKTRVKDTEPTCIDFSDVRKATRLELLTKEQLEDHAMAGAGFGVKRQILSRISTTDRDYGSAFGSGRLINKSNQPTRSSYQSEETGLFPLHQSKFMDQKNIERAQNCRNILQNQKLYAQTILVNARTGKQLKPIDAQGKVHSQPQLRGGTAAADTRRSRLGGKDFKNNTFAQYQGNLFTRTSNQQIAAILNGSKRCELSQLTEDLGIMKYLKKKFYTENFASKKEGEKSAFPNTQLEHIKRRYFEQIINEAKDKDGKMEPTLILEKIAQVDSHAKNIYQDILNKNKGLNNREGKMEAYQFDQEIFISPDMIGKEAVENAITLASPSGERAALHKDGTHTNTNSIQGPKQQSSGRHQEASKMQASHMTSFRTSEDFDSKQASQMDGSPVDGNKLSPYKKGEIDLDQQERKTQMDDNNTNSFQEQSHYGDDSTVSRSKRMNQQARGEASSRVASKNSGQLSKRMGQKSAGKTGYQTAFVPSKAKKVQQVYLEADYWYHKGVVLNQMQQNQYALNCYQQALKLNTNHRPSIFNLACAYEKLGEYEEALEGFLHAIAVDERWPDAHYGLALCSLKLLKNADAVTHIENAVRWSISQYEEIVQKRKQRDEDRRRAEAERAARGEGGPLNNVQSKDGKTLTLSSQERSNRVADTQDYPEDDDSQDELYIEPSTKKNKGVSTHIMYVRALCHREVAGYAMSLQSYAKVMKQEHEIGDYEKMIEEENFKALALKSVDGPGHPRWKIDFYSHFKRSSLLMKNQRIMMVDLREHYEWKNGWKHDQIQHVIKDLQRIRFFNRFDRETLYQMMKKVDLRVIQKHNLLFLEPDQCAIVINGNLNLFSHEHDVATPTLQAIYTPGDIIGNSSIDGGWSRNTHSWIIAYKECDVLVMNTEYVNYLWDRMKSSSEVCFIAERLQNEDWFKKLTEQSIYTIAFDLLYYKDFKQGEEICPQYTKSTWNFELINKQKRAFDKFQDQMGGDPTFQYAYQIFLKDKNPSIKDLWAEREISKAYTESVMKELNRRETLYGKIKNKGGEDDSIDYNEHINSEQDEDPNGSGKKIGDPNDPYKLSLPKFPTKVKLTAQQIKDERGIRERRQSPYTRMVKATEALYDSNKRGPLKLSELFAQHLAEYQKEQTALPKDSDGVYILLEGSVTVKNKFNPSDPDGAKGEPPIELYHKQEKTGSMNYRSSADKKVATQNDKPELLDVFGTEKFLLVHGFSYYGTIYATADHKKGPGTTCGYISAQNLALLPFYDLMELNKGLITEYHPMKKGRCKNLQKTTNEHYKVFKKLQQ